MANQDAIDTEATHLESSLMESQDKIRFDLADKRLFHPPRRLGGVVECFSSNPFYGYITVYPQASQVQIIICSLSLLNLHSLAMWDGDTGPSGAV